MNAKGSCIGPMGQRVRNVVAELHGEKIDIIDFNDDPARFVGNALSPAHAISITVVDEAARSARVVVPDFQLSLAIGREGQNARLAARLTGWRIDIHSDAEPKLSEKSDAEPKLSENSDAEPKRNEKSDAEPKLEAAAPDADGDPAPPIDVWPIGAVAAGDAASRDIALMSSDAGD